jgi:hypothetical protein
VRLNRALVLHLQVTESSVCADAASAPTEAVPAAAPTPDQATPAAPACAQPAATLEGATSPVAQQQPVQQQQRFATVVETNIPQQQQQHNSLLGQAVGAIAGDLPAGAPQSWEDRGLTVVAVVLVVLIAAILFRRILVIAGADVTSLM